MLKGVVFSYLFSSGKDTALSGCYVHNMMTMLKGLEKATKADSIVCRVTKIFTALAHTGLRFVGLEGHFCTPRHYSIT